MDNLSIWPVRGSSRNQGMETSISTLSEDSCITKSKHRSNRRKNASTQITVGKEPKIFFKKSTIPPRERLADAGESVTLTCEAAGTPPPTIHWLLNGVRIEQADTRMIDDDYAAFEDRLDKDGKPLIRVSTTHAQLNLPCVSSWDEGIYSCIAENPYQKIYTQTKLVVKDNVDIANEACVSVIEKTGIKPAHIYMWSRNRLEIQGNAVQLFCRAEGSPTPRVTWFDRDGSEISPDDRKYEILSNGDLLVKNIQWKSDMGRLSCKADNGLTKDTATTFLYPTTKG